MSRALPIIAAGMSALALLTGCESTQSRSADLESKGATVLKDRKGLSVEKESSTIKVTGTTALSDQNGAAVVVSLQNTSTEDYRDIPISVDVLNAKGKGVFTNDLPGLEPALVSLPFIRAGESVDWVNDQVLAVGSVASAKAKVGDVPPSPLPELPEIEVGEPKLESDPVSGTQAVGKVINRSGTEQQDLLLYAVARKGGKVVAAGRGIVPKLKETTKPVSFHIYFIGDPTGADVSVTPFPSIEKEK